MQSGITISNNTISGTLKHVTGYTGFSGVVNEQSGNYLTLRVETEPDDAIVTVELIGGTKGPVELDEDRNVVFRITDTDAQSIQVVAREGEFSVTKTYVLSGLTLETE